MNCRISPRLVLLPPLALLLPLFLAACGGGKGSGAAATAVAPSITAQPADQVVVVGQPATFTVTAAGTAPLMFQWQKGGAPIAGATASSYTTPATAQTDDGSTFLVVVSNAVGSLSSSSAKLQVASGTTMPRGTDVTTYKNDLSRSGQNLSESALTLTNVASSTFGLLRTLPVDGRVDAQPLYLSQLSVGGGSFNTVFVATEHDSVYAFDSDSGAVLWHVSLLGTGETTSDARGCNQVVPEIGVTSTPVIDRTAGAHGTLYVVAMSIDAQSNYHQRLHALDITTGAELLNGPVDISAAFPAGSTATSSFDPRAYEERAALLLSNGTIYTSWTSHCDHTPYGGWIIAYAQSTLARSAVLNVAPTVPADLQFGWRAAARRRTRAEIFICSRRTALSKRRWTPMVFPAARISATPSSRFRVPAPGSRCWTTSPCSMK
ncbi:MAG TPA: hypothetical protein VK495_04900 [Steroidobacteraceae bacterium]|nr:hypothetical protein [Steroidobacteraceae bacterium]